MSDPRFLQDGFTAQAAHVVEEKGELDKVLGDLLAAIGKAGRWGLDSVNPLLPADGRETNRAWITRAIEAVYPELDDVHQALDRLRLTMRTMVAEDRGWTPAVDQGPAHRLLSLARAYVADSLDAHEHSDGRELLTKIDAVLGAGVAR